MDKGRITCSFDGIWRGMNRNTRGILLPPPILEAMNLRNSEGERDKLILFRGSELICDLTYGLVKYLRAYDMNGIHKAETDLLGDCAKINRMRLKTFESFDCVLPFGNRVGIVGFENYFDMMDPSDMKSYIEAVREGGGFL